jgi:hypothetical protein
MCAFIVMGSSRPARPATGHALLLTRRGTARFVDVENLSVWSGGQDSYAEERNTNPKVEA